ncbi:MAG: 5-formyltetrahydrofolate cyclo-ligase [Burkholderia sp.]|nr:5-formyltetrahydrofolate cyclo-ligase [Burkholderia sp.]
MRCVLLEARRNAHTNPKKNVLLNMHVRIVLDRIISIRTIGFYWPLPNEFDTRPAVLSWCKFIKGRSGALPVIREKHAPLEFHRWDLSIPVRQGYYGITEPNSKEIIIPDLLLIPCIGFDLKNYRLGYGGGYYDRTLSMWTKMKVCPVTVGLAYEACKVNILPIEIHDHTLDWIVTEVAIYGKNNHIINTHN